LGKVEGYSDVEEPLKQGGGKNRPAAKSWGIEIAKRGGTRDGKS